MRHVHPSVMLYEGCHFLHAIAPRYFLGSNIGIPYDRIDLFETKRMESILPTSDSSFDSKTLMPKLLSKKVTDFRDSFSVKFLISNTTLPNQFVATFLNHSP